MPPPVTRRSLLGWVGTSTLLAAVPALAQTPPPSSRNWFFLTDAEARVLTVLVDRILPRDEWPSASEAGVVDFIDLQLATAWGQGQGLYRAGPHADGTPQQGYQLPHTPAELYREALAEIDRAVGANGFAGLAPDAQDQFLRRLERNEQRLGRISGGTFFTQLRNNVLEGYFADPYYNGNRDHVGWRMIGFPGAHAYYTTEVDRHGLRYERPPTGMAWQPGFRGVPPFTARDRAGLGG